MFFVKERIPRNFRLSLRLATFVILVNLASGATTASAQQFTPITYPGALATTCFGINAEGDVVGQYQTSDGRIHGYLLNATGFRPIDAPEAVLTSAFGINSRGDIAGRYDTSDGKAHGFLLREGAFLSVDIPGAIRTVANGINSEGDIAGNYTSPDGKRHGFVLTDAGFTATQQLYVQFGREFTSLDVPGAAFTGAAMAINPALDAVVLFRHRRPDARVSVVGRCVHGRGRSWRRPHPA